MPARDGSEYVWAAVEFEVTPEQEDLASWLVTHCGASGCWIQPREEGRVLIQGTFKKPKLAVEDVERLQASFEEYGLGHCLKSMRITTIHGKDWLEECKKGFEPFPVGDRLLVCPPWSRETVDPALAPNRRLLLLEPGMAFGTGLHQTTRYCMSALERLACGQDVADVGTGSGILAIAAALLHEQTSVTAVDVDPMAVREAVRNVELNSLTGRITVMEGSTEILDDQNFDCILSNLTYEDIKALLLEYLRLLRPDGVVICAGILVEKLPLLEKDLETYPLSIVERQVDGSWVGVVLSRIPVTLGVP